MLEAYLRKKREDRGVFLMTHIVIGYPDMETSMRTVEAMVEAGVDLMELQVLFSGAHSRWARNPACKSTRARGRCNRRGLFRVCRRGGEAF